MNELFLYHFDIFLLVVVSVVGVSLLSIFLLAKIFNSSVTGIHNASSVLFLTSITFFFFYEFFGAIFNIFKVGNNVFPVLLSLFVSFFVFKHVFQSRYAFHNRGWDVLKIFLLFLLTDALFIFFLFLILRTTKLV